MKNIIKTIAQIFFSTEKRDEVSENNLNLQPLSEEVTQNKPVLKQRSGQINIIKLPDLGNQKGLLLTRWNFKIGDLVKHGDILCVIENKEFTIEFESFFEGKLIWCCNINQPLSINSEICKIESA